MRRATRRRRYDFVAGIVEANCDFSIGFSISSSVREALLLAQEEDWTNAVEPDGSRRDGAWVVELTELLELSGWPEGTRLICRRERPHPGASLTLFDSGEGLRHTCFITNTAGSDIAALECRHRGHARVEDGVRNWKDCGLQNLPFEDVVRNMAWMQLSLVAGALLAWAQMTVLQGELARAEPKTIRYRLLHVAAVLVRRARRLVLRLDESWPWAEALATALTRLRTTFP